uniref:Uncharacterized protein n=1 Tax=Aegilops tauschii subsp. strangulata TaxID=200361 RepID=A0A453KQA3_AEGTS
CLSDFHHKSNSYNPRGSIKNTCAHIRKLSKHKHISAHLMSITPCDLYPIRTNTTTNTIE